ncbi:phosphoglycerate mutase-like protein [Meredithblackwellia eburnea MCA 4105]
MSFHYSVVPGFFYQDSPTFDPTKPYDSLSDDFGLLDKTEHGWYNLKLRLKELNEAGSLEGQRVEYKLLWCARHAEGFHNVAEAKYGTKAWDDYWSKLDGDGELVWGPDARLTPLGESQCQRVHDAWTSAIARSHADIPLPQSMYCSPMTRAARTLEITWKGLLVDLGKGGEDAKDGMRPRVKEGIRETVGVHTCDKRRTKTEFAHEFPNFTFDKSFTEMDEMWDKDYRETDGEQQERVRKVLDEIFETDPNTYVGLTTHGGILGNLGRMLGHQPIPLPTAGVVPIIVKAVRVKEEETKERETARERGGICGFLSSCF